MIKSVGIANCKKTTGEKFGECWGCALIMVMLYNSMSLSNLIELKLKGVHFTSYVNLKFVVCKFKINFKMYQLTKSSLRCYIRHFLDPL